MSQAEFEQWTSSIEKRVTDLSLEVMRATRFMEREHRTPTFQQPGLFGPQKSVPERPPAGFSTDGPFGHRRPPHLRDREFGSRPYSHDPVKGMIPPHPLRSDQYSSREFQDQCRARYGRLPLINFPRFDGSHPQLWKTQSENYFDMYEVHYSVWVRVATMHFEGRASRWLQSIER